MSKVFIYTDSTQDFDKCNVFLSKPYKNLKDLERQNQEDWAEGNIRPLVSYDFEELLEKSNVPAHRQLMNDIAETSERIEEDEIDFDEVFIAVSSETTWGIMDHRMSPADLKKVIEAAVNFGMKKERKHWRQKIRNLFKTKRSNDGSKKKNSARQEPKHESA